MNSSEKMQLTRMRTAGTFVAMAALVGCLQASCSLPLLNASAAGDLEKMRALIAQGQDVNGRFPFVGTGPLIVAAGHGHVDLVRALLDAGADVNAADVTGWTALHAAASKGDPATVVLLLERGAAVASHHWYLPSPLNIAQTLGHAEIIPLLQPPRNCQ